MGRVVKLRKPQAGSPQIAAKLPDTIRAFVAIALPDDLLATLRALEERLQSGLPKEAVRWVPPEQVHLTLKFLGNIATDNLSEIEGALERICQRSAPLWLRAEGLGCFPSPGRPRVLWIGLGGDLAQLQEVQAQINPALQPWCQRNEERVFHPHLTIGRVQEARPRVARAVGARVMAAPMVNHGEWKVEYINLMQSKLSPKGAEHATVASLPLLARTGAS